MGGKSNNNQIFLLVAVCAVVILVVVIMINISVRTAAPSGQLTLSTTQKRTLISSTKCFFVGPVSNKCNPDPCPLGFTEVGEGTIPVYYSAKGAIISSEYGFLSERYCMSNRYSAQFSNKCAWISPWPSSCYTPSCPPGFTEFGLSTVNTYLEEHPSTSTGVVYGGYSERICVV